MNIKEAKEREEALQEVSNFIQQLEKQKASKKTIFVLLIIIVFLGTTILKMGGLI